LSVHVLISAALVLAPAAATAQNVEDFYRGKSITMIVGGGVGGGYDLYARAFARHMPQHIPGNPNIVPRNVPAAGGLAAANLLYTSSERDGSVIGAFPNNVPMDPLLGNPGARYDPLQLNWLGSIGKLQNVCATWHTSPVRTIAAAREREVIVAAAGAASNTAVMPKVLNALLGSRFKVIAGYDPGSGLTMAIERGEAEGICGLSWSTMKASRPHWISQRLLNVLVQMGIEKLSDLPDVPAALDLTIDAADRQVLEVILLRQETGRPFAAPPDVARDRVAALRQAFAATLKDPAFMAEAARLQLEIEPLTGSEIDALLAKAYGSSARILQRAGELLERGGGKQ
jgi:tripartite-type tricarboxylate transporter receptor subunit TctC